jgi:hypothetical protein
VLGAQCIGAPGHGRSPRMHGEEEGSVTILTMGRVGRRGGRNGREGEEEDDDSASFLHGTRGQMTVQCSGARRHGQK